MLQSNPVFGSEAIRADDRFGVTAGQRRVIVYVLSFSIEAVMARDALFRKGTLSARERATVFDALLGACRWTQVYYLWRPNLPDEADDHLIELAVAGGAEAVVTKNVKDFSRADLQFARLAITTPGQLIEE